jgi:predicted nucleic acid-binding protein
LFCADTSCWVPYLAGQPGNDAKLIDQHLQQHSIVMCPVVLAELLSDPFRSLKAKENLLLIPLLDVKFEFWQRAGLTRAELLKHRVKPKLTDTLIAQFCIDHKLALHTRDTDFRPFAKHAGLQLVMHGLVN